MRSDTDVKRDVEDELRSDPTIDATNIAVAVRNGVVALTGFARSYMDKFGAETAAKRVADVVGLASDIEVGLIQGRPKTGSRDRSRRGRGPQEQIAPLQQPRQGRRR